MKASYFQQGHGSLPAAAAAAARAVHKPFQPEANTRNHIYLHAQQHQQAPVTLGGQLQQNSRTNSEGDYKLTLDEVRLTPLIEYVVWFGSA